MGDKMKELLANMLKEGKKLVDLTDKELGLLYIADDKGVEWRTVLYIAEEVQRRL